MDTKISAVITIADYVMQLVSDLNQQQIVDAVALYSNVPGLDSVDDQAIAIMGECKLHPYIRTKVSSLILHSFAIFICLTYLILQNFQGPKFKAEFAFLPGRTVAMLSTSRAAGL